MQIRQVYEKLYDEFGPQHWWPGDSIEEIVEGAILTQNTTWKNVEKGLENLKKEELLSFSALSKIDREELAQLIYSTGYYNQKAKRLKRIAKFFLKETPAEIGSKSVTYGREKLLRIKGIGKETADSILLYAFNKPIFVIDAYTKRVFQRLEGFPKETSYDKFQEFFMKSLPKDTQIYNEFHALLVKFAKVYCKKISLCEKCFLAEQCKNKNL